MSCCPNGVFTPLIIDCSGTIRTINSSETLRLGNTLGGVGEVSPGIVDNAVSRADGTANDKIQGSTAIITDDGELKLNQLASLEQAGNHGTVFNIVDSTGTKTAFQITAYTAASGNLAIGKNCGINLGSLGTTNILVGSSCGMVLEDGSNNVFLGNGTGQDATSASSNMAIGASALRTLTTGFTNVCIGVNSGHSILGTSSNVCLGFNCYFEGTGGQNVMIGKDTGRLLTTGDSNTFIGFEAGEGLLTTANQLLTVSRSTAIGSRSFTTKDDQVVIGGEDVVETVIHGDILIEDAYDLVFDTSTGSAIGSATTEKLSFWGATPIVQPTAANQAALTNSTGGTRDGTLAAVTDTSASDQSGPINDNFTDVHELLGEIRTALFNAGLIAGS